MRFARSMAPPEAKKGKTGFLVEEEPRAARVSSCSSTDYCLLPLRSSCLTSHFDVSRMTGRAGTDQRRFPRMSSLSLTVTVGHEPLRLLQRAHDPRTRPFPPRSRFLSLILYPSAFILNKTWKFPVLSYLAPSNRIALQRFQRCEAVERLERGYPVRLKEAPSGFALNALNGPGARTRSRTTRRHLSFAPHACCSTTPAPRFANPLAQNPSNPLNCEELCRGHPIRPTP